MNEMTILVRGLPFHLYEYEAVSEAIRQAGDFYEAPILEELEERLPTHDTIIDAGAHIGNHSLFWSAFVPHRRLYAFEPVPDNFTLLGKNLADYPRALCLRLALSDQPGYRRMVVDPVNMGRCQVDPTGTLYVSATTIDGVARRDNVTLLKIDVEGHEAKVAAGARKTIERCHPAIVVEDEFYKFGEALAGLQLDGYHQTASWPGHNYLWEWRA